MAAKKKIKKNNDEMIKWAGLIVLLVLLLIVGSAGAYYAMQPDPVAPALAIQKEMEKEDLTWDQRKEAFQKLGKAKEKLTPEQRYKVDMASPFLKKQVDAATAYFAMSPEARAEHLANEVAQMKTRMEEAKAKKEAAAAAALANGGEAPANPDGSSRRGRGGDAQGGAPGGPGGPGGGPEGKMTEQERDQFHRERVQELLPEQRAQIQVYRQEKMAAMAAAGITGGRGGPGGGGPGGGGPGGRRGQ